MSRPAVSQHLRVLRKAGLVDVRLDGTRRLYTARAVGLEEVIAFFEGLWHQGLADLKAAVEAEASTANKTRAGRP